MIVTIIFVVAIIIVFFLTILLGFFSLPIFLGLFFLGLIYLFGYFYVLNYFKSLEEIDREEKQNKKKLDYCWDRANAILKKMMGGQGLSWNKGVGRRSEYQSFHNGIQLCGFRSMEGYLSESNQLVVLIYDIENDDIVRYYANPNADIIDNHFHGFKPFQSKESFTSGGFARSSYYDSNYRRRPYARRGVTPYRDIGEFDSFDSFSSKAEPNENIVNDALKKINK